MTAWRSAAGDHCHESTLSQLLRVCPESAGMAHVPTDSHCDPEFSSLGHQGICCQVANHLPKGSSAFDHQPGRFSHLNLRFSRWIGLAQPYLVEILRDADDAVGANAHCIRFEQVICYDARVLSTGSVCLQEKTDELTKRNGIDFDAIACLLLTFQYESSLLVSPLGSFRSTIAVLLRTRNR